MPNSSCIVAFFTVNRADPHGLIDVMPQPCWDARTEATSNDRGKVACASLIAGINANTAATVHLILRVRVTLLRLSIFYSCVTRIRQVESENLAYTPQFIPWIKKNYPRN
jgi:hypothetical protein